MNSLAMETNRPGVFQPNNSRDAKLICFCSGKGGVGKTALTVKIARKLSRRGERVLLIDGDLGLGSLHLRFMKPCDPSFENVIWDGLDVRLAIARAQDGIDLLAAPVGSRRMNHLGPFVSRRLKAAVQSLKSDYDYILVDTSGGILESTFAFASMADHVVVLSKPSPESIVDTYGFFRASASEFNTSQIGIVTTDVRSFESGEATFRRIDSLCEKFLKINLNYWGCIFDMASHVWGSKDVNLEIILARIDADIRGKQRVWQ